MGTAGRSPVERKLDILRDHEWAGPLPIYAYLVEHPEGAFVVDTGDRARNSDRDYPPKLNPFFQRKVKIEVAPEEEVGPRLSALGVDPARDLRAVVMTHLHHDHTGGLYHFPHTRVIASDACLRAARRQRGLIGAMPGRWPRWFDPEPFRFDAGPVGPFPRSAALTEDGSIRVVETPGHMIGHVSLVARAADVTYLVAGDVSYRERNLLADAVDGVTYDVATSLRSQHAVKALAAEEPCVLLPAHDPDVPRRLEGRICMPGAKVSA